MVKKWLTTPALFFALKKKSFILQHNMKNQTSACLLRAKGKTSDWSIYFLYVCLEVHN